MRRELAIILGVLVPFAVLVVVGLRWTASVADAPTGTSTPVNPSVARSPTPPAPVAPTPDAGPTRAVAEVPAVDAGHDDPYPPQLAVPLRAVEPEVRVCLEDQRSRAPADLAVTVHFTPTPDGGFQRVSLKSSWQDPYLEACLQDVFAEVSFTPSGAEAFAPAAHTFHLSRAR